MEASVRDGFSGTVPNFYCRGCLKLGDEQFSFLDLESEMYQLSHLITEQKSLLTSLLELSITGERGPGSAAQEMIEVNPQELKRMQNRENRKKLTGLLEKIEGCSHVMEVEDRCLVFDGDLVELKQDDYTAKQRIHAYLLNDSLMIASWLSHRYYICMTL
ncbi:Exocyst complex component 8 [Portunus trituberculatus]|uniref:Exocyst complex component 8 n=1 Tax=Portunus trituberculatus TaxID=210409 RepID=A0A5B7EHI9_PORTR|nr:Exocyst complex component 8 [Portunus trituberculatus]